VTIDLSVNLNKVALIRNAREGEYPSVIEFARRSLDAGANGLTVHPRPDQRHIRPSDVLNISEFIRHYRNEKNNSVEFNIEGNPFAAPQDNYPGLIELVREARPDQCTLVPDSDTQKTSDHGFDLKSDASRLSPIISELKQLGCRVSLFMDPEVHQIGLAAKIGADRIELYTGPFAAACDKNSDAAEKSFNEHKTAAEHAHSLGLGINAGHDLNLINLERYKKLPFLLEVSIGHALTVDALIHGWEKTIRKYLEHLN